MDEKTKAIMKKRNMKLYPIYEMFGLDFMFYYVIELLFFMQVKGLTAADVVLLESFYAAFAIVMQFVVVIIANKIGKKKSIVLRQYSQFIGVSHHTIWKLFWLIYSSKSNQCHGIWFEKY